jgi:hypothetical protein
VLKQPLIIFNTFFPEFENSDEIELFIQGCSSRLLEQKGSINQTGF